MDRSSEGPLAEGYVAFHAQRFAAAFRLLLPLAAAGDPDAHCFVGSLLEWSWYRFESGEELERWADSGWTLDGAARRADRERAVGFYEAASRAGNGLASTYLARLVAQGDAGGDLEERRARAVELLALAHGQGAPWSEFSGPVDPSGELYRALVASWIGVGSS